MKVVVGCPIKNRAWIFPDWLDNVRLAFDIVGEKPTFAFVVGLEEDGTDDGTLDLVTEAFDEMGGVLHLEKEPSIPDQRVPWTVDRYQNIVDYRNTLLNIVRNMGADLFFSVDSDILLHPAALAVLLDSIKQFDAVSGKCYLGQNKNIVSYAMHHPNGGLRRQDQDGVFGVDVIMALKLMTPAAYSVDYSFSRWGEDIGWSDNCRNAGLKLGFDGRVTSKHIMFREKLGEVDPKVGW